jgi:hypothetical protein
VTIARKHRSPSSTTPREGSAKPPPASECAEASPKRAAIAIDASQSAIPTASDSTRGSSPAAPAAAASPADTKPPTLQPPCSEDITGRPRSRSTATPCAFIETSMAPLAAPKTNRIGPSARALGAISGNGSIRQ